MSGIDLVNKIRSETPAVNGAATEKMAEALETETVHSVIEEEVDALPLDVVFDLLQTCPGVPANGAGDDAQ